VIRNGSNIRYFVNNLESLTGVIDKAHTRMSSSLIAEALDGISLGLGPALIGATFWRSGWVYYDFFSPRRGAGRAILRPNLDRVLAGRPTGSTHGLTWVRPAGLTRHLLQKMMCVQCSKKVCITKVFSINEKRITLQVSVSFTSMSSYSFINVINCHHCQCSQMS